MYVLLFDIDGTLLSSGGAGKAAMEHALATEFGVTVGTHGIPFAGRTDRAIGRDLFRHHAVAESDHGWQRFLTTYLRHLPDFLVSHPGRIMPGIAELLDQLRERDDVALGLLTGNIRAGAQIKLGHYGLYHHFSFGGFGDEHHERDDVARAALAEVRRAVGEAVALEKVWVIGDTPLDVRCARAIGARVAAVATGWHTQEQLAAAAPDLVFADLADPTPLLDGLQ